MNSGAVTAAAQPSRKASKEVRRQQLIDATIEAIAKRGYSNMTLGDVAKAAAHGALTAREIREWDQYACHRNLQRTRAGANASRPNAQPKGTKASCRV